MKKLKPQFKIKKFYFLILFFSFSLLFFNFSDAEAAASASLLISPASGSFYVGSTFDVSVILNTDGESVNTIEAEINFPADKLQIASPSLGKSIIQIWASQPVFSNKEGKIYFVGGIPSPGIATSNGVVQTIQFRVASSGRAEISFGEKSSVLANDGLGTDILTQTNSAFYNFSLPPPEGPRVSSPTHLEQGKWYKDNNPMLVWAKDPGVTGYSYSIDKDPSGIPDTVSEGPEAGTSYKDLESSIWYFHIRANTQGVWGGVTTFALNIDHSPPADFSINVSPSVRTTNRSPILRYFTTDALSGFDHFEMKVVPLTIKQSAEGFFFEAASPQQLNKIEPGRYNVIIRAVDKAGNTRDKSVVINIISSFFQFFTSEGVDLIYVFLPWGSFLAGLALTLLFIIAAVGFVWWRHHPHLKQAMRQDARRMKKVLRRNSQPEEK